MKFKNPDDAWDNFWKPICCFSDGSIDIESVKGELFDFQNIIESASEINCAVTNGMLSYPDYPAETVLQLFEDNFLDKKYVLDDVMNIVKNRVDEDVIEDLKNYFN